MTSCRVRENARRSSVKKAAARWTAPATQELLGWTPTGPTLADDLTAGAYRDPLVR
jgi:hypothetical protein